MGHTPTRYINPTFVSSQSLQLLPFKTKNQNKMGKRFKVRISRVIPSSCCRSKNPKLLPANPIPSFLRHSNANPITTVHFSPPHEHRRSFRRHFSSAVISMVCGVRSRNRSRYLTPASTGSPPTPQFHWQEDEKFHVVETTSTTLTTPRQKIYNSSASGYTSPDERYDDVLFPSLPPIITERGKRHGRRKKTTPFPTFKPRVSVSSVDTDLFTSESREENNNNKKNVKNEEGEETETLVSSSRSFTTETSTEFKMKKRAKRSVSKPKPRRSLSISMSSVFSSPEIETPARLSMFLQRLIPCSVEGKVRESFAVVKKSEDPYEDFRKSMMEMIEEKEMFEEQELEELLQCFLTLNSRQHHRVIVEAFTKIWEDLFYRRFSTCRISTSN